MQFLTSDFFGYLRFRADFHVRQLPIDRQLALRPHALKFIQARYFGEPGASTGNLRPAFPLKWILWLRMS